MSRTRNREVLSAVQLGDLHNYNERPAKFSRFHIVTRPSDIHTYGIGAWPEK
jgi:hypothetical protein